MNCYAERMAARLKAMGQLNYRNGFKKVTCHEHMLEYPLRWKKPRSIFVNSMSDLFHEDVPDSFIFQIFEVMKKAWWHRFQVLTKRAERLASLNHSLPWPNNIWMGVTVENDDNCHRIDFLRNTAAAIKFLSMEPLLSAVQELDLRGIDWVIVGGESGPSARPMEREWVDDIFHQCRRNRIPFFFKQWGGINKKTTGRILHDRTYDEMPGSPKRESRLSPPAICSTI